MATAKITVLTCVSKEVKNLFSELLAKSNVPKEVIDQFDEIPICAGDEDLMVTELNKTRTKKKVKRDPSKLTERQKFIGQCMKTCSAQFKAQNPVVPTPTPAPAPAPNKPKAGKGKGKTA